MGIFDKFKIGFKKSASALTSGLKEIIIKKEIDDENLDKIEERGTGLFFFTGLQDNLKPFIGHNYPTVMSGAIYFQGDCGEFRLKPIRTSAYGKPMGQEHIETKDFPKSAWHQIPPKSLQGVMLRKVCNH